MLDRMVLPLKVDENGQLVFSAHDQMPVLLEAVQPVELVKVAGVTGPARIGEAGINAIARHSFGDVVLGSGKLLAGQWHRNGVNKVRKKEFAASVVQAQFWVKTIGFSVLH